MRVKPFDFLIAIFAFACIGANVTLAAEARRPAEWERILEAAKKEGKIVLAIPPAPELRKELENVLKQKFGLEAELQAAPGPRNATRIASERNAGAWRVLPPRRPPPPPLPSL